MAGKKASKKFIYNFDKVGVKAAGARVGAKVNERTSRRVAKIAGRVLKQISEMSAVPADGLHIADCCMVGPEICTIADLKALAASCLTQTYNKKEK